MTPVEKIVSQESQNSSVIILRPEGMFFRAYERSAYLVCKTITEFKPTIRKSDRKLSPLASLRRLIRIRNSLTGLSGKSYSLTL